MNEYNRALMELNKRHQELYNRAEIIRHFDNTDNLYSWEQVADNIINNYESAELPSSEKCPICNGPLDKTLYQLKHSDYVELYFCEHCRKQFNSEFQLLKDPNSTITDIADVDFSQINPAIAILVDRLVKMGCNPYYYNRGGIYGYVIFEYKTAKLGIVIDKGYTITVLYPNWISIPSEEFSPQLISRIQGNNLNKDCTVYWLLNNNDVLLSSTINLDTDAISMNPTDYIVAKLDTLTDSRKLIFCDLDDGGMTKRPNFTNHKIAGLVQAILVECGCLIQEIDEDGDLWFKYGQKDMYAHMIDEQTIKLVSNCMELNCIDQSPNKGITNGMDQIALSLQWINMIFPVKVTYFKPEECRHSITANIDVDVSHFTDKNIELISQIIRSLSVADENYIYDIVFGTEKGIDIINTWYQPSISNL